MNVISFGKLSFLLLCSFLFLTLPAYTQSEITVNKVKLNRLDKQNRKQGDWIFFDREGNIRLSCRFENNRISGPVCWYENTDTAFIRFPKKEDRETFIVYENNRSYTGDFIHTTDSTYQIELDPDSTISPAVISKIKKYWNSNASPVYYFAQKKLVDVVSMGFNSIKYNFNKPVYLLVCINDAGVVTDIEFPKDINRLTPEEERELYTAFISMPRWQPAFYRNKTIASKILVARNSSISVSASDFKFPL